MQTPPFDVPRQLTIPTGYSIAVYARVPGARFLTRVPNGDLLVSVPSQGKLVLLRPNPGGNPTLFNFATGLKRPHDMVFHTIGGTIWLYVAESNQITRSVYMNGDTSRRSRTVIVANLPDGGSVGGPYNHELKNIALDQNHRLFVSIASTCNACLSDTQSNPVRGSVYVYNANGTGGRLYARGIRNAEGLDFIPNLTKLWVVVNNRDQIPYPFNDSTGNYGRIIPSYVDNHPPEELIGLQDGGNYGWPFCNPNPDTPNGMDNMPFDRDYNLNRNGQVNCNTMRRVTKGIQAHSAPLGLTFLHGTTFNPTYRVGAMVALHGSWNRTQKTGYKVIYFPWDPVANRPGPEYDFVRGWLVGNTNWGRPVDTAVDPAGALLISDDQSGTVYRLN